ncbi:MAG: hypothetical protein FD141_181 [Fusobacteria bacterium]|nr:MAG: hypothetical protein FD141_181 [Fusobacteriota bacterium]KAF0229155.1 MAG: hypothetical protein FD182_1411 [Fusobacteriota bacterium]
MELINRYIYAVTKSFPKKQKLEIEEELKANIEDMIEQNSSNYSHEEKVKKALLELGNPEIVADNYRGSKRFLIGPFYYELYLMVLKIVVAAVVGGISIALFIKSFFTANIDIANIGLEYLTSIFSGAMQAFAWTTIVFIIIERNNAKLRDELKDKESWDLTKLPLLPNKKTQIPISEPIAAIIFTTIFFSVFLGILYSAPEAFAVYFEKAGEMMRIPIFEIDVLKGYRSWFIAIFFLSILKEIFSLYYRKWNLKNSLVSIFIITITAILGVIIITDNSLWNPNFPTEILKQIQGSFDFPGFWLNIRNWIVAFFIIINVGEILSILYKGIYLNRKLQ